MNGFVLSGELRPVMFVCVFARMTSSASPTPAGRSMQTVGRLAEVGGDAVVALERRLDDLLLDLPVERDRDLVARVVLADVDERVLLGELGQRRPERALLVRLAGEHDGLERRPREARRRLVAGRRLADRVADPDRAEPADRRHLARARTSRRGAPAGANTRIEVAFASSPPPTRTRWRGRSVPANRRT